MLRAIGLMSGTSLDGVDAAWVETDGETVGRIGAAMTLPYDEALRADMRRLLDAAPGLSQDDPSVAAIAARVTARHVEAVSQLSTQMGAVPDILGFHGQTILHQPDRRRTWQIGDATALARACGVPVAYDFRSADVAAGGQGAPLAPIWHAVLASALPRPLAVLNIGGVSNVTLITQDSLTACDCGPGNGPLDDWTARHTGDAFDRDGALSAAGRVDETVLASLMGHPFFAQPAPKSLDRLDFARSLAASGLERLAPADGAATIVAFIAAAIAGTPLPAQPQRFLVSGGGRHNPSIMQALAARLGVPVDPVEAVGWDGDAVEAQCFALLAVRTQLGLPISFPGTTGAPIPMTGGRMALPDLETLPA